MTTDHLAAALRACAAGLLPLEAGVTLLIANGTFLHRDDFTSRFIEHSTSNSSHMAAIDWEAAITALDAGELPSSAGEKRMLRLAASLADHVTVSLGEAVTGIDDRNFTLFIKAVLHAAGQRQFPR